jgi:hypothetical protein
MTKIAIAVTLLVAVSLQSQASSPRAPVAAPPPLVEKIDVSVVNVDVTVTGPHGKAIRNFTAVFRTIGCCVLKRRCCVLKEITAM